jgi:hypothetical protein
MLEIQNNLISKYNVFIEQRGVETGRHRHYVKWLHYYLDFCHKYSFNQTEKESLPAFLKKLGEKKQAEKNFVEQSVYHSHLIGSRFNVGYLIF